MCKEYSDRSCQECLSLYQLETLLLQKVCVKLILPYTSIRFLYLLKRETFRSAQRVTCFTWFCNNACYLPIRVSIALGEKVIFFMCFQNPRT